jgi:hypothetical protein
MDHWSLNDDFPVSQWSTRQLHPTLRFPWQGGLKIQRQYGIPEVQQLRDASRAGFNRQRSEIAELYNLHLESTDAPSMSQKLINIDMYLPKL